MKKTSINLFFLVSINVETVSSEESTVLGTNLKASHNLQPEEDVRHHQNYSNSNLNTYSTTLFITLSIREKSDFI